MTKQTKPNYLFSLWDIALYLVLVVLIGSLFFVFVLFPKDKEAIGFKVYANGKEILRYEYSNDKLELVDQSYAYLINQEGNRLTIYTDSTKEKFNTLEIDVRNNSVSVISANCSVSKECVHTPPLNTQNGAIVCAKHKLKIVPLSWSGLTPPQSGGVL